MEQIFEALWSLVNVIALGGVVYFIVLLARFFRNSNKWKEVYITQELEQFYRAQNLLTESNINYRTDIVSNSLRLSANRVGGRTGMVVGRDGGTKDFHKILVEEKDQNKARGILSKCPS